MKEINEMNEWLVKREANLEKFEQFMKERAELHEMYMERCEQRMKNYEELCNKHMTEREERYEQRIKAYKVFMLLGGLGGCWTLMALINNIMMVIQ